MSLTLSINSTKGQNEAGEEITIEEGAITIGRSANNNLCLSDPDKVISGLHATISFQNGLCTITDKSTNGTYLNSEKEMIGRGNSSDLKTGDYLLIGQYTLDVVITQNTIDKPIAGRDTDFENPFRTEVHQTNPHFSDTLDRVTGLPPSFPDFGVDNEYNPPAAKQPFSDWRHEVLPNLPIKKEKTPSPSSADSFPEDWDTMPKTELPSAPLKSSPAPTHTEQKQAVNVATTDTEWQQAVAQFLDGAELPSSSPVASQISSETFFTIGQLLKTSVYGTKEVLSSRTEIKNEMRLDATMIRPTSNNPIKQALGGKDALQRLLLPQESGYLTADQAMNEAFDDIKAHQIAVLAGMQEALQSVLKRFAPEVLTERLERHNPIGANIPIHRQAKLWELFVQLYEDIIQEEENNFNQLFGNIFSEIYEKQTATFKQQAKQINP